MNSREKMVTEAATWVVRMEAGLDDAGQDAFLEWLAADARHGVEFERQRSYWSRLDILAALRPAGKVNPDCAIGPSDSGGSAWLKIPNPKIPNPK